MRCVGGGAWKPLLPTLDKRCGAQDQSGIGVAFLLVTFLWPSKEKSLGCRSENRHKKGRRASDTLFRIRVGTKTVPTLRN
ncbi:hypothetical protein A1332_11140 [Methylomonas methanica]|uniref:Uncharacterized protein n=1 Tax=Methylomonas methanica TaxID=421 RepID=A0A177MLV6_METMH|nr:hypothetical protein A1332_11140 [Methylomonas methanica]